MKYPSKELNEIRKQSLNEYLATIDPGKLLFVIRSRVELYTDQPRSATDKKLSNLYFTHKSVYQSLEYRDRFTKNGNIQCSKNDHVSQKGQRNRLSLSIQYFKKAASILPETITIF